jgi:hypothetical protein
MTLHHKNCFPRLLLTALLAVITAGGTAEAQSPPAGWAIFPSSPEDNTSDVRSPQRSGYLIPAYSSTMECANYSRLEWRVSLSEAGSAQITPRPEPYESYKRELPSGVKVQRGMAGIERNLKIENGWLLGFDGGEFGGGLWFADLSGKTQELSGENVHGFIETPQGVLVIAGLAHMGLDSGKVLIVPYAVNSQSDLKTLMDLDGAPGAFTKLSADTALVVTTHGISRISSSGLRKTLLRSDFSALYPNSVVSTTDGTIYVGMRLFVVRLLHQSGKYTAQWLVPDSCRHFKVRDLDCVCTK